MNRNFIIIFLLAINLIIYAQPGLPPRCPYKGIQAPDSRIIKEVEDFTITTTDGVTRNLYTTLDSGNTVFIDLFYTTCTFCQLYAPVIEEVYQETGAGEGDIEFWGISNNLYDTNWVIDQYRENYNITNPCAGPYGGGLTAFSIIVNEQNFNGFPTYCVICPDRNMYFDVCYPPVAACFYPYFEDCTVGIQDHNYRQDQSGIVSVYPNPATDGIFVDIITNSMINITIEICNPLGIKVSSISFEGLDKSQTQFVPLNNLPPGIYFVKLMQNNLVLDIHNILIF